MTRSIIKKLVPILIIANLAWLPGCAEKPQQKPVRKITQQKPQPPAQFKSMLSEEKLLLENLQQEAKKEKLAAKQAAAEAKLKAEAAALEKARTEALAKKAQEEQVKQKAQKEAQSKEKQSVTPAPTVPSPTAPVTPGPAAPNSIAPQIPQTSQGPGQEQTTSTPTVQVLAQGSQQIAFWQQTTQLVQKLNKDWNALEPQAIKAGLSTTQRNNIKKALDSLTSATGAQNTEKSLLAAIELFGQSGNLAKVFMSPVPPEYFQLNYEIMMSAMEAGKMQWSAAEARIPKIQSTWNTVKSTANGKNTSLINQTQLSIFDYKKAIQNRQMEVVLAQSEIVIQNLRAIEESLTAAATTATGTTGQ